MIYVRSVDTVQHVKSELDTYLEEGVFICKENSNDFDVLEWWKANNLKFIILSKNVATNKGSTSSGIGKGKTIITKRSKYEKYVRSVDTVQHVKSKLDTYLEE